ncbi:hypothetical protein Tco_0962664, partial [Tanacetum coccineum]
KYNGMASTFKFGYGLALFRSRRASLGLFSRALPDLLSSDFSMTSSLAL